MPRLIGRSFCGFRASKLRSNVLRTLLRLIFRFPCVRSGGSDALRSDLGAFGARSGVVLEFRGRNVSAFDDLGRPRACEANMLRL